MTRPVSIAAAAGLPFIDVEREFDAPVSAVFNAHADPDLFVQWIGPARGTVTLHRFDFRTGGGYRYIHHNEHDFAFHGVFHLVRNGQAIIQTFEYEGYPDHVSLDHLRFESRPGGRTLLRSHAVYPSVRDRDGILASGMQAGVVEGFAKLDALLQRPTRPRPATAG